MKLFTVLFAGILSSLAVFFARKHAKRYLMTFFRDLSRFKARKRLYGNNAALMPLLLGKEQPVELFVDPGADDFTMTVEQLAEMDGRTETTPIYIAIKGSIYDVSAAREMYGPGGSYHLFTGKDASRAFASGCLEEKCMVSSLDGLSETDVKEIDRWVELYHNHDKYTYVGRLITEDPVDSSVSAELARQQQEEEEVELH